MKKWVKILFIGLFIIGLLVGLYLGLRPSKTSFSDLYTKVDEDNVFVEKSIDEVLKILENGTGIVYIGFPSCPWCQAYVAYLNETAKENDLDTIYYLDIYDERKENTAEYQKIVEILTNYLRYDEEGNKRIYVPAVVAVSEGIIVGFDDETSYDTKGYDDPESYWEKFGTSNLKSKLKSMIEDTKSTVCTDCNK